jgi:hypothetical protein
MPSKRQPLSSNPQTHKQHLDALRVVVVLLSAGRSAGASSRTRVSLSAALSILLRGDSATGRRGLSRLSNRRHSARSSRCRLSSRSRAHSRGGSSSGGSRRGTSGSSARPDGRSDTGVGGGAAVDVEHNTGFVLLVGAGEGDTGGESGGAAAADLDVYALHVELGALGFGALVESEDFGAENVLAGSHASGDLVCMLVCG